MNIEELLEQAQLPQKTASICIRTDLVARWEELHAEFKQADTEAKSLGEPSPRAAIARELQELQEQLNQHRVTFTFEALPTGEYSQLLEQHPGQGSKKLNTDTLLPALLARCCINPVMTEQQATALVAKLSLGQADELFTAAWNVNQSTVDIPFDASVYAATLADDA